MGGRAAQSLHPSSRERRRIMNGNGGGSGQAVVMVRTMEGAVVFWPDRDRREWRMDGPHFKGEAVYAMALDQRGGRQRTLAATRSFHWGSVIRASDDFGATWTAPDRQNVRFAEGSSDALVQVWQIMPGREIGRAHV